jgi:hypothetical protein
MENIFQMGMGFDISRISIDSKEIFSNGGASNHFYNYNYEFVSKKSPSAFYPTEGGCVLTTVYTRLDDVNFQFPTQTAANL